MRIVGIVIALIFALASFLLVYNLIGKEDQPKLVVSQQQPIQTVGVVVAKRNIELGEVLSEDALDAKQWPQHLILEGFATTEESGASVIGQVARSPFTKGEPINIRRLSNPEDPNFIAANLPSGMRMVTMSSDAVAGLAGFVLPGDRVDVVVTRKHMLDQEESTLTGIRDKSVTETLVSNVRVLAVNQRATVQSNSADPAQQERDKIPSSVSVEVSLEDAQRIRLAQDMGYVSLALRALSDKDAEPQFAVTIDKDLTNYVHVPAKKKEETEKVGVIRGVQRTDIELKKKMDEEEEGAVAEDSEKSVDEVSKDGSEYKE
jgi:pilus assembly protein CpaB